MSESLIDSIYRGVVQVREPNPQLQKFFADNKKYLEEQKALGKDDPMPYLQYLKRKKYRERLGTCKCDPVHVC